MIEIISLSKYFGEKQALNQLNLRIEPGELFCLLGPNGAGKTTTIKILLGFMPPSSGMARVVGFDAQKQAEAVRERLAYIPETLMLYPHLTGVENLRFFSRLARRRFSTAALESRLLEAGLPREYLHQRAAAYSKGMRQKVGIAIALAKDAAALLLDEPTSGLDPQAAHEFCASLSRLKSSGKSILMTTHDLFRAQAIADRIGIMSQGRLLAILNPQKVSHQELEEKYLEVINPEYAATQRPALYSSQARRQ
jgi:ABC-2 type transport system ATP-binding protein